MSIGGIVYGKSNMINKFSKFIITKVDSNKKYRMLIAHANCQNDGEKLLNNIINYRPNIVIGTGGFASGPIVFIASLLGVPTLIHEQNSLVYRLFAMLLNLPHMFRVTFHYLLV